MICDRLRELRENKNLSQGDIEENLPTLPTIPFAENDLAISRRSIIRSLRSFAQSATRKTRQGARSW